MRRVLVIEDDRDLAHLVTVHLVDLGCEVEAVHDGREGLDLARSRPFDLVILDLALPGMDGLDVCRRLREGPDYTPILMLTARSSEVDRVLGLEIGADDYLTKPFSVRELLARVKALFRRVEALQARGQPDRKPPLRAGELFIDPESRTVRLGDELVHLTAKEFDLLLHFAAHPERVYTRSQLLDLVWGPGTTGYEHTVNSHINRLRAKIENDPSQPQFIVTVWGVGYKFSDQGSPESSRK
ncbi:MAG: response regulator transcription factor [Acidobacteriota bacterium]|nr:MAG: response regulator transcription factor [Acidobacteriota bacterium]